MEAEVRAWLYETLKLEGLVQGKCHGEQQQIPELSQGTMVELSRIMRATQEEDKRTGLQVCC